LHVLAHIIDMILHLDRTLAEVVRDYRTWTYLFLFLIIFCETGLVITPCRPGDSLLFAVGTFAARGALDLTVSIVVLSAAAILGDTANYWIGNRFGAYLIHRHPRWLRKEHLDRTHAFFEKYGGKTIVIARFVPIVRTFAPFVAGLGAMSYRKFLAYNVVGAALWILGFTLAGYFFGGIPIVQQNFSYVIYAIIALSLFAVGSIVVGVFRTVRTCAVDDHKDEKKKD
jgi:membrane-associated protein